MQVKIILLALVVGFGPCVASAQTSDAEAEAVIHLLGVQKKRGHCQTGAGLWQRFGRVLEALR